MWTCRLDALVALRHSDASVCNFASVCAHQEYSPSLEEAIPDLVCEEELLELRVHLYTVRVKPSLGQRCNASWVGTCPRQAALEGIYLGGEWIAARGMGLFMPGTWSALDETISPRNRDGIKLVHFPPAVRGDTFMSAITWRLASPASLEPPAQQNARRKSNVCQRLTRAGFEGSVCTDH